MINSETTGRARQLQVLPRSGMVDQKIAMDSTTPNILPDDYLTSAAALLVKSSVSLAEQYQEGLPDVFPSESNADTVIYELMAFLSSITLHQARAKLQQSVNGDINQICHALKDGLARATQQDPTLLQHAKHFDEQSFHDLIACYFKGSINGFDFSTDEIQVTSKETGLSIPTNPGIEAIFLALLIRLSRLESIQSVSDPSNRKQTAATLTQLTETGISSFGLALQVLG